jgi:hypothetical protein
MCDGDGNTETETLDMLCPSVQCRTEITNERPSLASSLRHPTLSCCCHAQHNSRPDPSEALQLREQGRVTRGVLPPPKGWS